jgi:hypothetical protein
MCFAMLNCGNKVSSLYGILFSLMLTQVCGQVFLPNISTRLTVVQGSPLTIIGISYTAVRIYRIQGDCQTLEVLHHKEKHRISIKC